MSTNVFNRYEHKHLLNQETFELFVQTVSRRMELDPYNEGGGLYTISNLYYDTADDFLIRRSLSKPVYKEKLRLRSYAAAAPDSKVYLEIKKKYRGAVNKRRVSLPLSEAYELIKTGAADSPSQIAREIEYFLSLYDLGPKVYIAYDRLAYHDIEDKSLRISFDANIRTRRDNLRLEAGDYGLPLLPDNTWLMEIKSGPAKPLWLCRLLSELEIKRVSFSKYGTEYKRHLSEAEIILADAI